LARLDDPKTTTTDDPAKAEGAAGQNCGDKRPSPQRGEARLSSQILNVLLRLQQQEENTQGDNTPTDTPAAGDPATDGTTTVEASVSVTVVETTTVSVTTDGSVRHRG